LEYLVNDAGGTPLQVNKICPIGDEAAGRHEFSQPMQRRQMLPSREVRDELSMRNGERVFDRNQCVRAPSLCSIECAIKVVGATHLQGLNLYAQCPARNLRLF
jgi:hypothetical protein